MNYQIALGSRERKSPYFESTVKAGVTHFTIYNHMYMPVSYGNRMGEYDRLMNGVAIWDVAAERQVELNGPDALTLAKYMTPRNLEKFTVGQGKYVPICNHEGHLLNDPILIKLSETRYWLSIADQDLLPVAHAIAAERGLDVNVFEPDVSPLAVQGPKAEDLMVDLLGEWVREIKYFWFKSATLDGIPFKIMRSGWSKQGGFELFLEDGSRGDDLWAIIVEAGTKYEIGPGAPNYIERIESGLLSFGADTYTDSTPFEVGLGSLIDLNREDDFVGKQALIKEKAAGIKRQLVGLKLDGGPLITNEHPWTVSKNGVNVGKVSAVAYSPKFSANIAIALVNTDVSQEGTVLEVEGSSIVLEVEGAGMMYSAIVTPLPFKL